MDYSFYRSVDHIYPYYNRNTLTLLLQTYIRLLYWYMSLCNKYKRSIRIFTFVRFYTSYHFLFTLAFSLWSIYALIPRLQNFSKTQNTIKRLTYPSLHLLLLCIISWMSFITYHAYHQFIEKLESPIGRIATPIDRFFWVAPSIIKERISTSYYLEEMKSEHHF